MVENCPFCGKAELSWEDFGNFQGDCAGTLVCTSCGGVIDETNLTTDDAGPSKQTSATFHQPTAKERQLHNVRRGAPSITRGRRMGLELTKRLCQHLQCKSNMTAAAVGLFERVYSHPNFRSRRQVVKRAISICSVYIACRQQNWPITLSDVCSLADAALSAVESWKRRIMLTFTDLSEIQSLNVLQLVEARCKKAAVSDIVQNTSVAILKLCKDLWLVDGRKPDNIIVAMIFIAWQAEQPARRLKAKLANFCRDYHLQYSSRMVKFLKEIRQTLCGLAKKIPWVSVDNLCELNVALHVEDIVSYRAVLIGEAKADIRRIVSSDEDKDEFNDNGDEDTRVRSNDQTAVDHHNVDAIDESSVISHDSQLTNIDQKNNVKLKYTTKRHHEDAFEAFWPPPLYKPKKKSKQYTDSPVEHPDLDSTQLGNDDIPDDKMHLFIK